MPSIATDFSKGANNRAPENRMPAGFVRSAINVVSRQDGSLAIAPGAQLVLSAQIRGACWFAGQIIIADGFGLSRIHPDRLQPEQLVVGRFSSLFSSEVGDLLYIQAGSRRMVYDGLSITDAPIKPNPPSLAAIAGGLRAGRYKVCTVAVKYLGDTVRGRKLRSAPSEPAYIDIEDGQGISVSGGGMVFISQPNSSELYLQCDSAGHVEISIVRSDTEPLDNSGATQMPACSGLCSVGSQAAGFIGRNVFYSLPFLPWLHDPVAGVLSFPSDVESIVGDGRTLYVSADKLYAVTGLDTETPSQIVVYSRPVQGLTAMLDGGAFAMTDQGPIILPQASTPAKDAWASSQKTAVGAVVDSDGDRLILIATDTHGVNRAQAINTRG